MSSGCLLDCTLRNVHSDLCVNTTLFYDGTGTAEWYIGVIGAF